MDGHLLSSFIRKEGQVWRWSRKGAQAADPAESPASSSTVAPCLPLRCLHTSSKLWLTLIPMRQEGSGYLRCTHRWAEGRVGRVDTQLSRGHLGERGLDPPGAGERSSKPGLLGPGGVDGRMAPDSLQSLFGREHPSFPITLHSPLLVQLQSQI